MKNFVFVLFLVNLVSSQVLDSEIDEDNGLYTIEGKVYPPEIDNNNNWQAETTIEINSGILLNAKITKQIHKPLNLT